MKTRSIYPDWAQRLWDHMNQDHDLSLTESELADIQNCIVVFDPEKETEEFHQSSKRGLFDEVSPEDETTFQKSVVSNKSLFLQKLSDMDAAGVDVDYYYNAVSDWCESLREKDKRKKRTAKGWIATARRFMRTDKKDKKLVMKLIDQKKNDDTSAIDFLKIGRE